MRTAGQGPGGFEKRDGFIKPGQDLVVAGYAGMAGARLIFQKKKGKTGRPFCTFFSQMSGKGRQLPCKRVA